MIVAADVKKAWRYLRGQTRVYLANGDPLAAAANAGAFIVWGNQPFYPIYVWLLVGRDAWPSLLTWFSTPAFFAVPLIARKSSIAGRALFTLTGVGNTLLSAKAFGLDTNVAWFLVPCLILALGFFRPSEWRTSVVLGFVVAGAGLTLRYLGYPMHTYTSSQAESMSRLNLWSAGVLSIYLIYAAIHAHRKASS